jgi:hypothetical protein
METLGTMYTGPSSYRIQGFIMDHLCANEMSSLQWELIACVITNGRKISDMFNLPIFVDGLVNNVVVSRSFASSRGTEESAGRNRHCYRTRAFPGLRGSSEITIR